MSAREHNWFSQLDADQATRYKRLVQIRTKVRESTGLPSICQECGENPCICAELGSTETTCLFEQLVRLRSDFRKQYHMAPSCLTCGGAPCVSPETCQSCDRPNISSNNGRAEAMAGMNNLLILTHIQRAVRKWLKKRKLDAKTSAQPESESKCAEEDEFFAKLFQYKNCKETFDQLWEEIAQDDVELVRALLDLASFKNVGDLLQQAKDGSVASKYADVAEVGQKHALPWLKSILDDISSGCYSMELKKEQLQLPNQIKSRQRSEEKVEDDYDGQWGLLFDVVRGSVKCKSVAEVIGVWDALQKLKGVTVIRCKNRFKDALFTGYRDMLLNLKLDFPEMGIHHIVELQIHHEKILKAKGQAHAVYEYFRSYFAGNAAAVDKRLALLLSMAGEAASIEEVVEQALQGEDIERMRNLVKLLKQLARFQMAESLMRRIVDLTVSECGEEHQDAISGTCKLAHLVSAQNKLEEAEVLFLKASELQKQRLGHKHPATLKTMNALAVVLRKQNKMEDAELLYQSLLPSMEEVLGKHHPQTLCTTANLAKLLAKRRKNEEAEQLYRVALVGQEQQLGKNHSEMLNTMHNLANLLIDLNRLTEAEDLLRRSFDGHMKEHGDGHPETLRAEANLASLLLEKKELDKAATHYHHAWDGLEKVFGSDHPDTVRTVRSLAKVMRAQRDWKGAEDLYSQVWERQKLALGEDNLSTLQTMTSLAYVIEKQGNLEKTEKLYRAALKGFVGKSQRDAENTAKDLAKVLTKMGRTDEAKEIKASFKK